MQCQFPTTVKGDAVFAVISFYWHWNSSSGAVFRTANVTGSSFLHANALVGIALRGWGYASGICI